MLHSVVVAVAFVVAAAGCGGDATAGPTASVAPVTQQAVQPATAPAKSRESPTAAAIVRKLQATKLGLTDGVARSAGPEGYLSRASAGPPGGDKSAEKHTVGRGLVVEVFDTADLAQRRSDDIKRLQAGSPILGTEGHYRTGDGTGLVRVSGNVKPSPARKREASVAEL